jgi:hypothetical protein
LVDLFRSAAIDRVSVELREGTMTYPSIATFVEAEVKGSPLEALFDEESYRALVAEAEAKLHFRTDHGQIVMPLDAFIITAEKP